MKLLLDTNIIIDVLTKRKGYMASLSLIKYCELGTAEGFVSASTVTDVVYILRKHLPPNEMKTALHTLFLIVDIANVLKVDITSAFNSEMRDFEDAVQAACALRIGADYIVTRNLKDFENAPVPSISPENMLEILSGISTNDKV